MLKFQEAEKAETLESDVESVQLGAIRKIPLPKAIFSLELQFTGASNTPEDENRSLNKNLIGQQETQIAQTVNQNQTINHTA